MKQKSNSKGFTLLEIMIVVAIMAIMSGSVLVGFGGLYSSIQVRETTGIVLDQVKKLEVEVLTRDYKRNLVHFEDSFLVVESEVEGSELAFNYLGLGQGTCSESMAALEIITGPKTIQLAKRDSQGNNLEITSIPTDTTVCIDFLASSELEWQYQTFNSTDQSDHIRFIHFNLRQDSESDLVTMVNDEEYTLEISAPYAQKKFYNAGVAHNGNVDLTYQNDEGDEETINLLNIL